MLDSDEQEWQGFVKSIKNSLKKEIKQIKTKFTTHIQRGNKETKAYVDAQISNQIKMSEERITSEMKEINAEVKGLRKMVKQIVKNPKILNLNQ